MSQALFVSVMTVLLYGLAGILTDFLVAKYYLFLSNHRRVPASLFAVLIDFCGFLITSFLVLDRNYLGAFSFAIGTGIGTWIALGKK